jgi:hypothetical protein
MGMNPRLLRPTPTGFDPRRIAGLGMWLDASVDSSLTFNGNNASEWRDLSGNGRNVSQGTAGKQPSAVSRTQNGRRVLDFTGTEELLGNAASQSLLRNVGGATIIAAAKWDLLSTPPNNLAYFAAFFSTGANAAQGRALLTSQGGSQGITAGGRRLDANSFQSVSVVATTDPLVGASVLNYASASAFIYLNGALGNQSTSFQTAGNTSDTDSLAVAIGSGNNLTFLDGWVGEVLVWPRALTDSERQRVERYLGRKWGITVA